MIQMAQDDQLEAREQPTKPVQVVTMPLLLADADDVAAMLRVSKRTVYSMQSSGELGPMALKVGGCKRWIIAEVIAWVEAGCPHRQEWAKRAGEWRARINKFPVGNVEYRW